ncbi:MAG: hypothetical protein JKX98_09100 [Alcanivoracaceae bacterium]|nr:hypothetical protein [Alcanivoracaceae bacterium]
MVEAYSRYTIIVPNLKPMTQHEFEDVLLKQWGNEFLSAIWIKRKTTRFNR